MERLDAVASEKRLTCSHSARRSRVWGCQRQLLENLRTRWPSFQSPFLLCGRPVKLFPGLPVREHPHRDLALSLFSHSNIPSTCLFTSPGCWPFPVSTAPGPLKFPKMTAQCATFHRGLCLRVICTGYQGSSVRTFWTPEVDLCRGDDRAFRPVRWALPALNERDSQGPPFANRRASASQNNVLTLSLHPQPPVPSVNQRGLSKQRLWSLQE